MRRGEHPLPRVEGLRLSFETQAYLHLQHHRPAGVAGRGAERGGEEGQVRHFLYCVQRRRLKVFM